MKNKNRLTTVLIYVVLIIGALVMVFPFVWMVLTAVKTNARCFRCRRLYCRKNGIFLPL